MVKKLFLFFLGLLALITLVLSALGLLSGLTGKIISVAGTCAYIILCVSEGKGETVWQKIWDVLLGLVFVLITVIQFVRY